MFSFTPETYVAYILEVSSLERHLGRYPDKDFILDSVLNGSGRATIDQQISLIKEYQAKNILPKGDMLIYPGTYGIEEGLILPQPLQGHENEGIPFPSEYLPKTPGESIFVTYDTLGYRYDEVIDRMHLSDMLYIRVFKEVYGGDNSHVLFPGMSLSACENIYSIIKTLF